MNSSPLPSYSYFRRTYSWNMEKHFTETYREKQPLKVIRNKPWLKLSLGLSYIKRRVGNITKKKKKRRVLNSILFSLLMNKVDIFP